MKQPRVIILAGIPSSGKSTLAASLREHWPDVNRDPTIVSSGRYTEEFAKEANLHYNEAFKHHVGVAIKAMLNEVRSLVSDNKDFIWDQTSVSVSSRKRKYLMIPKHYLIHIAYIIPPKNIKELDELYFSQLYHGNNKVIPKKVIEQMFNTWETPTMRESSRIKSITPFTIHDINVIREEKKESKPNDKGDIS